MEESARLIPTRHFTPEYLAYLNSDAWREKRAEAIAYAGARCSECGRKTSLHVHHKHYRTLYSERLEDLEVLCRTCHIRKHPHMQVNFKTAPDKDDPDYREWRRVVRAIARAMRKRGAPPEECRRCRKRAEAMLLAIVNETGKMPSE